VDRPADRVERAKGSRVTTLAPPLEGQLQGYLDHLTIERGVAANTLSSYRRDLRRYFEHLTVRGVDDLAKVSEADVSEFLMALRRGDPDSGVSPLSAVSAARTLIAVRGLHRFAAAEGLAEFDVAQAVKPPTPGRRLPKSLSLDQVLALLAGAGGDSPSDGPLTLRNRALLELLYSTGARISEAVGLDVDDIDTHARSVLLRGKGGKPRLVPIGRPAVQAVEAYTVRGRSELARRGRGTPAIFLNARGGRLVAPERVASPAGRRGASRYHRRRLAAHAAALVCDPPIGRWGRRPRGAGIAGTRVGDHDADLHHGHRARAARSVGRGSPAGALTAQVLRLEDQIRDQGLILQMRLVLDRFPLRALLLSHVFAVFRGTWHLDVVGHHDRALMQPSPVEGCSAGPADRRPCRGREIRNRVRQS